MRRTSAFAITLAFVLMVLLYSQSPDDFLLSASKAGRVEIGMTIDHVYAVHPRNQTRLTDLALEGFFSPALEIMDSGRSGSAPSLTLEIGWNQNWVVSRIMVHDQRYKTDSGIGVGSLLGDVRRKYNVDWIDLGEGHLVASVDSIGMGFLLDSQIISESWYQKRDKNLIPDSEKVIGVLIH